MSSQLELKEGKKAFKPKQTAHGRIRNQVRAQEMDIDRLEEGIRAMRMDVDEPDQQITSPSAKQSIGQSIDQRLDEPENSQERPMQTFKLLAVLPSAGLDIHDRNPNRKWFLDREANDREIVLTLYKDMPRDRKPHKRFVQPIIARTFKATEMVSQGMVIQVMPGMAQSLDEHTESAVQKYMWSEFLRKLAWRDHQQWSSSLPEWLFCAFFSALVNSRQMGKSLQYGRVRQGKEALEMHLKLSGLTLGAPGEGQRGELSQSAAREHINTINKAGGQADRKP